MTNTEIIVNLATIIAEQRLEISELKTEVTHLHHELVATMKEADTPQTEIKTGCSRCEAKGWCRDADSEVARWCNNYNKDTQTDCGWK